MVDASCLCGDVAWRVDGPTGDMTHCHCSMCRKAHGAAFATFLDVPESSFRWLCGEDLVDTYRPPEAEFFRHAFCRVCGASVPRLVDRRARAHVPAGSRHSSPPARPL